jgi:hypothetical protein
MPARHWYSIDPIKVMVTVAVLTVAACLVGLMEYRRALAALPETGQARPLDPEEIMFPQFQPPEATRCEPAETRVDMRLR